MLKNYLKITLRNLFRFKTYSTIVISGLAIGIAAALMIFSFVFHEQSFDKFHKKGENIFRLNIMKIENGELTYKSPYSFPAQGPLMKSEFPEIKDYARLLSQDPFVLSRTSEQNQIISSRINSFYYTDPSFFQIFSFQLINGNPNNILNNPDEIVISEKLAHRFFGQENPMGKLLFMNNENPYKVTGVFKDIPENSHLKFDLLLSINSISWLDSWLDHSFFTYVLLKQRSDQKIVSNKLAPLFYQHWKREEQTLEWEFQNISDIYLRSADFTSKPGQINFGSVKTTYFMSLVALVILIIAWINYINLSTAKSLDRSKEVGIRKTSGANRINLIHQFFFESALYNLVGLILAIIIAEMTMPWLKQIMHLSSNISVFSFNEIFLIIGLVLILGTLFSGFYPAFVISSYLPVKTFRKTARFSLRHSLVIFQFSAVIALITVTLFVQNQINYMQETTLGFQKDQILVLRAPDVSFDHSRDKFATFQSELKKYADIRDVTASLSIPGERFGVGNGGIHRISHPENEVYLRVGRVYPNFIDFYSIELLSGRNFFDNPASDIKSVLINETALKELQFKKPENAIGEQIRWWGKQFDIIGIIKDFHQESLHKRPEPMLMYVEAHKNRYDYFSIKINSKNLTKTISIIEQEYATIFPGNPFDSFFLDSFFNQQYKADLQFGRLFNVFAVLAMIIGFIGLFGLITYTILQRTKEIGIRKVVGASVSKIVTILSYDFIKSVLIANIIAWPIIWFVTKSWLQNFAYRIDLTIWPFLLAGISVLVIALLTVSWQAIKAATSNPIEALRYE